MSKSTGQETTKNKAAFCRHLVFVQSLDLLRFFTCKSHQSKAIGCLKSVCAPALVRVAKLDMHLPYASVEQTAIVESVVNDGMHVRIDAVAGSGKTTTVLHVAAAIPGSQVLLITYNAKLKSETRARCSELGIRNIAVHTYHSAALNMYADAGCARDEGIAGLLIGEVRKPEVRFQSIYDVLVVDEAQDMTHLYFALTRKLLSDTCVPNARVVVLGDAQQSIYGFKGADARFLTLADRLPSFASDRRPWRQLSLETSYRLAPRLANFVNSHMMGGLQLIKCPDATKVHGVRQGVVRYLRCNSFGPLPFNEITRWLASGIRGSDIFVLAPSIRASRMMSPVRSLENKLVKAGVPCYAASSDDERLDEDVTRGKVVFATFHQVKGLERKAVMVFNFDASYHQYYDRSGSGCSNAMYVAVTRAKTELTVVHDAKNAVFRTVRTGNLAADCEIVYDGTRMSAPRPTVSSSGSAPCKHCTEIGVTELLRHQKADVVCKALEYISMSDEHPIEKDRIVNTLLSRKVATGKDTWEYVAAITGTAMPCMYEHATCGRCTLMTRAALRARTLPDADRLRITKLSQKGGRMTIAEFLYLANVHLTLTGGFTHKLRQIKSYDWVDEKDAALMMDVMRERVTGPPGSVSYEHPASMEFDVAVGGRSRRVGLACAIDCLDATTSTAWEIKCVGVITSEHVLQTALNALLLEHGVGCEGGAGFAAKYRHVILNLCDGSTKEIDFGDGRGVRRAAELLLEAKYADEAISGDTQFLTSLESDATRAEKSTAVDTTTETAPGSANDTYGFLSDDE